MFADAVGVEKAVLAILALASFLVIEPEAFKRVTSLTVVVTRIVPGSWQRSKPRNAGRESEAASKSAELAVGA